MNKDTTWRIFLGIILLLMGSLFLLAIFVMFDGVTSTKIGTEETNCYDKFGNKIEGLTCTKNIYCGGIGKILGNCGGGE